MGDLRERTQARLDELVTAREKFVIEAQQRIAAFDTVIAELEQLLKDDAEEEPSADG